MRLKIRTYDGIWRRWFAWYPVVIDDEWVWLEYVERRETWQPVGESAWRQYRHHV